MELRWVVPRGTSPKLPVLQYRFHAGEQWSVVPTVAVDVEPAVSKPGPWPPAPPKQADEPRPVLHKECATMLPHERCDECRPPNSKSMDEHEIRDALMAHNLPTNFSYRRAFELGTQHSHEVRIDTVPPPYTTRIGDAGNNYLALFRNAPPLPAQFRWQELWETLCEAAYGGKPVELPHSQTAEPMPGMWPPPHPDSRTNTWTTAELLHRYIEQTRTADADAVDAARWRHFVNAGGDLTLRLHNSRPDARALILDAAMTQAPAPVADHVPAGPEIEAATDAKLGIELLPPIRVPAVTAGLIKKFAELQGVMPQALVREVLVERFSAGGASSPAAAPAAQPQQPAEPQHRPPTEWYRRMIHDTDGLDDALPCGALAQPQQPVREPMSRTLALALWGPRSDGPSNAEIVGFARAVERNCAERWGIALAQESNT